MHDDTDHFVLICSTCTGTASADAVQDRLTDKLPSGFAIRHVACMAGCAHPITVGFQAAGKAQYLFGDIQTTQEIEALADFAVQYRHSNDGWTNATDRPRALLTKTLSRMPRIGGA
ncbi:DUF1636 domain-containing protein [Ruegeria sp.]|uniref:DUF1636 domain-containing protein n=1 Tax=Ruegeria sp. TaxID=1879320 RepID=UPI00232397D0|nr:DUF1636 domain-containing protein [Ruegeria sp.]MDA7966711.1 DUF1636 domain-containing protein [Ruegeria sp.]